MVDEGDSQESGSGGNRCELLCLDLPHAEQVRGRLPEGESARLHAERFRALGDPVRLRIAAALQTGGECCVCDLAWICGASQNLVSHHLRVLRSASLVTSRRQGKLVMYRLTDAAHLLLAAGLATPLSTDPSASTVSHSTAGWHHEALEV